MEAKVRILAFSPKHSGCGYHRVVLPITEAGGINATITNNLHAIEPEPFDFLFFNRLTRFCDGDLDAARKKHGCKIIMDIDDDWHLPPDHPYFELYREEIGPLIEKNIQQADAIITTHTRLADKIQAYNQNITIAPNAIPFDSGQFNDFREESETVRIFWCGGSTHQQDLEILRNPIRRLHAHRNQITMNIGGYMADNQTAKEIWEAMANSLTDSKTLPFGIYPGRAPNQYMDLYNHADISLIPLRNTEWNAHKSNLKILEAAAKKIPAVVSRVPPYSDDTDAPVKWVTKQSDWYTNIKNLIHDKKEREQSAAELQQWARAKYDLRKINQVRFAAFGSPRQAPANL